MALLAVALLLGLRACAPVQALDLAWSDRLQGLHARSVESGPVVLVSTDGPGATAAGPAAVMAEVQNLQLNGAAAVGVYRPHSTRPLAWPDADGVVRRLYLRPQPATPQEEAAGDLGALLRATAASAGWPERTAPPPGGGPPALPPGWRLDHPVLLAYAGASGHFVPLALEDVMAGRGPPGGWSGKRVLLGPTGAGADWFVTPAGGSHQAMAGVEWAAHALDALLRGATLGAMPTALAHGLGLALLLPWLGAMGLLGPLGWLVATTTTVVAALALEALLQAQFQSVWGPGALVATVVLVALAWALYRLAGVAQALLPGGHEATSRRAPGARGDPLLRRLRLALSLRQAQAAEHRWCRAMQQQQPDAALVCDTDGRVLQGNQAAVRLFGLDASVDWRVLPLEVLLEGLLGTHDASGRGVAPARRLCQAALGGALVHSQHEWVDQHGRDLLIKVAPVFDERRAHSGWLLTLLDISMFRSRQRQRDDELHFLGHDLRGPQSAALAVLELTRRQQNPVDVPVLIERVERHIRRALALSDGFVQLLRAQDGQLHREPVNLVNLVEAVVDEHWDQARLRRVVLTGDGLPDEALVLGDHEMLGRALGNLVSNAIKFTLEGSAVGCRLYREGECWVIDVTDQGEGISREDQEKIFRPFSRSQRTRHVEGAGLGLPMVKTVVERHQGTLEVRSEVGRGSTFRVLLAAWVDPASARGAA